MKKLAVYVTVLVAFLCLGACSTQAPTLVPTPKASPVSASPAIPENTINPSTSPRKAEIDKSLIETVHWKKRTIYPNEEWYLNDYLFSNGKYLLYFTSGYREGRYMLNVGGSYRLNDISPLIPGKSSPPEYYSLVSDMKGDQFELRYFPTEKKLRVIDNGHRLDNNNYSGDYECVIQKIAKYPKGAIVFTRMDDIGYQSVVMIPYVDGSADFIVNEKDTYHCDSYSKSDVPLYTRVYKCTKDGKEAMFSITVGNNSDPSSVTLFGNLLDQDLYGAYHADSTKY